MYTEFDLSTQVGKVKSEILDRLLGIQRFIPRKFSLHSMKNNDRLWFCSGQSHFKHYIFISCKKEKLKCSYW